MDRRESAEGWQRNVWALTLCVFIAFVGFQFFNPFLPLYVRELGVAGGPAIGGLVASPLGTRVAFFITAAMCALALVALIVLFKEGRPHESAAARAASRPAPLREFFRYRHFVPVMLLLLIAQFID